MLGYKHIFADIGMKCMVGFSIDYFSVKAGESKDKFGSYRTDESSDDGHFNAMFGWNIGLPFVF